MKHIEEIEMNVSPENVLPGYIVKVPIYIGLRFSHDALNQVSDVQIICLPDLIDKLNWARLKHDIGCIISAAMIEISRDKEKGLYA